MMLPVPGPRVVRGPFFFLLLLPGLCWSAPYRPADDDTVLARLPAGAASGRLQAAPVLEAATATVVARAYIARARQDGDPRFFGYAEGALAQWPSAATAPTEIAMMKATLLQSRHEFEAALAVLDAVEARDPGHVQALLTRATILRVQGRYGLALAACAAMAGQAAGAAAQLCAIGVQSMQGGLTDAAAQLKAMRGRIRGEPTSIQLWYFAEAADMAARLGQPLLALALYEEGMAVTGGDAGLRAAAADLLLGLSRPADAITMLGADVRGDGLLLRKAIAARQLASPDHELELQLADAYAATRRRGDSPHLREEAMFALDVQRQAQRALALASENWETQREPADALVLARAAVAVGTAEARKALRDWQSASGMQDARIDALLAGVVR